jgi:hypothetical protein
MRLEALILLKITVTPVGNLTSDLPAFSAVSQPTALPHSRTTPFKYVYCLLRVSDFVKSRQRTVKYYINTYISVLTYF